MITPYTSSLHGSIVAAAASGSFPPPTRTVSSTPSIATIADAKEQDKLLKKEFIKRANLLFVELNQQFKKLALLQLPQNKKIEEWRATLQETTNTLEKTEDQDVAIKAVARALTASLDLFKSSNDNRLQLISKIRALGNLLIKQGFKLAPSKELEMPTRVKQLKEAFERLCLLINCNRNAIDIPATPAEGLLILIDRLNSRFPLVSPKLGVEILSQLPSEKSLKIIRSISLEKPTWGYPALALWIEKSRKDVRTLDLSPKEILGIKDLLHRLVITKPFTSKAEAQDFIAGFPEMTSLHMDCYHAKASLGMIRSMILQKPKPIGYRALASWINGHKISLASLKLKEEEIEEIKPYLSYVDLKGMPLHFDTKEAALAFIAGFSEMTHLTLSSITIGDKPVPLDSLPVTDEQIKQLRYLDCSFTSITTLPRMFALKDLICNNCKDLTILHDMPALEFLNCGHCKSLTALPRRMLVLRELLCDNCTGLKTLPDDMPALTGLFCSDCILLTDLPQLSALEFLTCSGCLRLPDKSVLRAKLPRLII